MSLIALVLQPLRCVYNQPVDDAHYFSGEQPYGASNIEKSVAQEQCPYVLSEEPSGLTSLQTIHGQPIRLYGAMRSNVARPKIRSPAITRGGKFVRAYDRTFFYTSGYSRCCALRQQRVSTQYLSQCLYSTIRDQSSRPSERRLCCTFGYTLDIDNALVRTFFFEKGAVEGIYIGLRRAITKP